MRIKTKISERTNSRETIPEIKSKFPHEQKALEQIFEALHRHVELIPNYNLYDPSTNQYLECDLIVLCTDVIAIAELKHWAGLVEIRPNHWLRGTDQRPWPDPHPSNSYKCKVLRSFCTKHFPYIHRDFWFESIVLLTNPDATVLHPHKPNTELRNPTFHGIDDFAKYFKSRLGSPNPNLKKAQVQTIAERLRAEARGPRAKGLHIPGYEILENLTQSAHRIELLARPTSNALQTVKRLRIFSVDPTLSPEEREHQRTKSRNSLKALTSISDYPNILKVWDIHHEDGLIIEASDWSQKEGTLANVMEKRGVFSLAAALPILRGIAEGLAAVHEKLIIHRNLTPENIMMFGDTPKLMNFDLSYLPEDHRLTVLPDDVILAKIPYLAPELYVRQPFGEATDLFSLGVIAIEMLTGEPPFEVSESLFSDADGIYEKVETALKRADVPESLRTDLMMMIQLDLKDRPQDVKDFLLSLREMSDGEPVEPATPPAEPNRVLRPDEICGVYTINEWIGRGREAQVYKALRDDDGWVAIKLFHQDVPRERIFVERDALKSLSNPYIVRCETHNQWKDGRYYLVLDMVSGESMRAKIEKNDRPEIEAFCRVARSLMDALTAMHRHPRRTEALLHNDIKPDNILINEDGDPVLIDFGTASSPNHGPYMGTDAYVPPDLLQGAEYEFCESGDLFALGVTLFEWLCGVSPYAGTPSISATPRTVAAFRADLPEDIAAWLQKAVQPLRYHRFERIEAMTAAFEAIFEATEVDTEPEETEEEESPATETEAPPFETPMDTRAGHRSEFLDYLNTLHNTTANNRNALAEAQAKSRFFGTIHVSWPLTERIVDTLTAPDGGNVILTGHAGDGKSTIGLDIFKRLKGIPIEKHLEQGIAEIESIPMEGRTLHIVKDMSEIGEERRPHIISKVVQGDGRWLIISNTGALLETLEGLASNYGQTEIDVGNDLLRALQEKEPTRFDALGASFTLINLSQLDNLQIARLLFEKLIKNGHWNECERCDIRDFCPVHINLRAIREAENTVMDRVSWIYRLLYEYGNRQTLRQISAHLTYGLTAGLDCERIREMVEGPDAPMVNAYLFYNRFFGFRGARIDEESHRLKAIQYLMPMEMGARPFLPVDRVLWTSETGLSARFPTALQPVFDGLRAASNSGYGAEATGARERQEFRRLFYIFGDFGNAAVQKGFVSGFTGSPMLVETESWQAGGKTSFSTRRQDELKKKVLHVLIEQFTGLYIPENQTGNTLFITLSRRNEALRQSVQILLADIPFSNFELRLKEMYVTFTPQRYLLVLCDRYNKKIRLPLDLPFLDYVMMRSDGELGQRLNQGYLDRLERFKNMLLSEHQRESGEEMRLIQLNNDGNLEEFRVVISDQLLEVL